MPTTRRRYLKCRNGRGLRVSESVSDRRAVIFSRIVSRLSERDVAPPVACAGLLLVALAARIAIDRDVLAPWIMPDELQYTDAARSFASTGHYLFRAHPYPLKTIYPALISPAWLVGSTHTAYALTKAINVVLMTAGAIPLYLWARRLAAPIWALLAVVLYLAMPGFAYTGEILTENAFVPATVLALFAIAVAIERPSLLRQLLALGAMALAIAARLQGAILLVVVPTAILLAVLLDAVAAPPGERRRVVGGRLRQFWPSVAAIAFTVVAYIAYEASEGRSLSGGLGVYQDVTNAHYSFVPVVRWVVYHFGDISFALGIIPLAAFIVLLGLACRRETAPGPAERAFVAVAMSAVVWTALQVGAFASHFSLRIQERYLFSVFPVLLLALAVWLGRGLPRPPALTAVAALISMGFVLALPFETLIGTGAFFTDTFGLIPFWRLATVLAGGAGDARILVAAGALLAGGLFSALPRDWARVVLPVAVVGYLILASHSVFGEVNVVSNATRHAGGLVGDPSWIDDAIGKDKRVEFLYTTDIDIDQHILWQDEFWNRSVRRVFGVTSQDPTIPDVTAPLAASGRIVPELPAASPDAGPRYVVAAATLDVVGRRIASAGTLALYRVRPPLRLATLATGLTADGWTGASAAYTHYVAVRRGAHLVVAISRPKLIGPPPATVTATVGRISEANGVPTVGRVWVRKTWVLRNGTTHHFDFALRPGPFQVQLSVSPTFSPATYGLSDTRTLGVQASFGLTK
jgi:hypothetical protein